MTTTAATSEQKNFSSPDETRTFEHGLVELVDIAGTQIGRITLQPGWRWSEHVKPIAGTDLCEAPHFQYHVRAPCGSGWPTAPSSTPGPATSPHFPRATTPGSSATSRSWSSTGGVPRTTPRADRSTYPGDRGAGFQPRVARFRDGRRAPSSTTGG